MKPYILSIQIGLFLLLIACKSEELNLNKDGLVGLGDTIVLKTGQTAAIQSEHLTISFNKVVSDSRCPEGAMCFWAGEAVCELNVTDNNRSFQFNASTLGGGGYVDINDHIVCLAAVLPYPSVFKRDAPDYSIKVIVRKPSRPLVEATVKNFTGLDGCGFVIVLDDGTKLEPAKRNDAFNSFVFKDNQAIALSYTVLRNTGSICMVGQAIQIDEIYTRLE